MREKSLPLRWFQQFILLLRSLPLFAFSVPDYENSYVGFDSKP